VHDETVEEYRLKPQVLAALALLTFAQPALADRVDNLVADQMKVSHLPGVAVAIVDHGKVTKLAAYGDANLEWPAKVDVDTRFQLASATKLFTGILLMRSVEQGKLSLDDRISKFFPASPDAWSRIRVRQLANHSSGLNESLGQPRPKTVADAVTASMKQPLAYEPGTEARYGFTDFTILRAIIEKVNGATLPELLDRELVRPLGLTGTGFALAEDDGDVRTGELIHKRASIYGWSGHHQRNSDFFFEPLGYGAGGLFSSARDLAQLFAALDQGRVIKPESLLELTTPATLPNGRKSGFGVGWTVRDYHGLPVVGHSGGPALADILRIPSQHRTIIVLTNQQNFYPVLAERIADLTIPEQPLKGIADDQPSISSNLLGLFSSVSSGAEDVAAFVSPGSKPAEPLRSGFGKALVEAIGPLKKVALVRVNQDGWRVYRLQFERKQWDWAVKADSTGRISDMHPAA
jgi:CubicO group peptidase (beta-lactamase class C family)